MVEWLQDTDHSFYPNPDKHKYLHNKFIKARQTKVSGRSVFRCRITQNPIKQLLKAIDMGFLSDYCKVVLTEKDYGELF